MKKIVILFLYVICFEITFGQAYGRIKLQPTTFASYVDIQTESDPFLVISYKGKFILSTSLKLNQNEGEWTNEYVIFDYEPDTPIDLFFYDRDPGANVLIGHHTLTNPIFQTYTARGNWSGNGRSYNYQINISDAQYDNVESTGLNAPENGFTFMQMVGGMVLTWAVTRDLESNSNRFMRLAKNTSACAVEYQASSLFDNPAIAATVADAIDAVLKERGLSRESISKNTLSNWVIAKLKDEGKIDLANALTGAVFLGCVTEKW